MRFLLFLLFYNFALSFAQDSSFITNSNFPHVKWIAEYPSIEKENKSFSEKMNSIIFGKKPCFLSKPMNIVAQNPNSFWVLDQGSEKIFQISNNSLKNNRFLSQELTGFSSLVGICTINNSKILFTDSHLKSIYLIDLNKKQVTQLNDSLSLARPTGIAYSKDNNEIWVVETAKHRISVLNQKGEIIKTIGGRGNSYGEFNYPTFIWIDKFGTAYIVDTMNFRIQMFNKNGEFISAFGQIGDATGYFARPKGIATDSYGNIYVVDALFHVVQVFDKAGTYLYRFGEQGQGKAQFWMPTGIYIDKDNFIYVADSYNSRIQIFKLEVNDI